MLKKEYLEALIFDMGLRKENATTYWTENAGYDDEAACYYRGQIQALEWAIRKAETLLELAD